jgi:hypothetical protein
MIKNSVFQFFCLSLIFAICSCAPVTIKTVPQDAAVYSADGKTQLGTTPFDTSVFISDKNFVVRKDRYFDEPVKLDFDSPRDIDLKLRPVPVLIYSKPDADIYEAGNETPVGRTPMNVSVYDKEHTYTLKKTDYYDQTITVGASSPNPIVVKLARRPIVTISAVPEGVEVYENGKLIGTAPVREEISTPRTFELRKPGYFTKAGTLTGAPPYEVSIQLRPFPVITVTAAPVGAQIYRDGGLIGKDSVKLPVGEQTVLQVKADRYYTQSVTLTPESSAQVNVALKAMPYVMINSQPAGAEVFIAGKSAGVAPIEQLIEKDTVVELRKEGFIAKTATLTGADKEVTIVLEAAPATPTATPAAETGVKASVADATASQVAAVTAQEPAVAEKKQGMPWVVIGVAIAAIAGLAFFLIKRKKENQ